MVKTILDEMREAHERMRALVATAEGDDRDLTPDEDKEFKALDERLKTLDAKRKRADGFASALKTVEGYFAPGNGNGAAKPSPVATRDTAVRSMMGGVLPLINGDRLSLGSKFVENEQIRTLLGQPRQGQWTSPPIEIDAAVTITPTTAIPPGVIVVPPPPVYPWDLVSTRFGQGTTEAGSIPYLQETSFTNAADYVAVGAAKPESAKVFTLASATLLKIAHIIKVPDEFLDDIPALRAYIDANMVGGLIEKLETEVVGGVGGAGKIQGLLTLPGKHADVDYTAGPYIQTIAAAWAAIWTASKYRPETIVLSPTTYQTVTMQSNSQGAPYFPNPWSPGTQPLYGMTPVISPQVPDGTAIIGNFPVGGMLFRKGGISLQATNTDVDDFQKNITTIRAEMRVALVYWVPGAFGLVTGLEPAGP
jgi:hypothetical protein